MQADASRPRRNVPISALSMRTGDQHSCEYAIVSPKAVGQAMIFLISVELRRDNVNCFSDFKSKVKKSPRVQQCYYRYMSLVKQILL